MQECNINEIHKVRHELEDILRNKVMFYSSVFDDKMIMTVFDEKIMISNDKVIVSSFR